MASKIVAASIDDLDGLAQLFNEYRQFYHQSDDLQRARDFIATRLHMQDAHIIIAKDKQGMALGFALFYQSFSSIRTQPVLLLNDVYVTQHARCVGIGRELVAWVKQYAVDHHFAYVSLETHKTNLKAQGLYQALGFEKDGEFFTYVLDVEAMLK